ncbi:MAG: 3-dehydroquinate synthase [Cyclobacteriaceae bacterium]|nr:3-dehydroquinate synthase [Cyclobacteriaceae bacterium]
MSPDRVVITNDIRHILGQYLQEHSFSGIAVLVDENTRQHCLPHINELLENAVVIEIPSGEVNKNLDTCKLIWQLLTEACFDRQGLLINLGGGVIGDMGGFCAATFKRGISFINIPTTLLAQVDASIGGKLGIDFSGYKNHIGVFSTPDHVMSDPVFLDTLPEKELRSGFAEVIKHALISDAEYWPGIAQHEFSAQDWPSHIQHSIKIKKQIVAGDPTEKGLRKILNFGHTLGHAIESYFLTHPGNHLLHGEAVAAGMIMESYLSADKLGIPGNEVSEIENFIISVFDKIPISEKDLEPLIDLSIQDKKNEKGIINFSLLKRIGQATYNIPVSRLEMKEALRRYMSIR